MACPGSADLTRSIPGWVPPVVDETKGARGRGTLIHEIMANILGLSPSEMQHLGEAVDYVAALRKRRRFKQLVEETVTAEWLPSKPKTTVDLVLYVQDELHIVDWKTGAIEVKVEDNPQLLFYAATHHHLAPMAKEFHLHIVQPWSKHGSSEWVVSAKELAAFMNDAIDTDRKILAGDTTLSPSDNCTFCPAYPHSRGEKGTPLCPAAMQVLYPTPYDEDEILAL